ncbi:MAG: IS30 family transposase [Muribaculaceae bacterium]|nr:IS30 family transposase [Muribaculaceae bacterium]
MGISHERIYQAIRSDESGELRAHCRHKMKYRRHKASKKKAAGRSLIPDRVSIHDRPKEADGKRFGDWEMDLVIGKGQKSAVLTLVERSTNMFLQKKLSSKQPSHVARAAWLLLLPYKGHVLTITTDNGLEFREHAWLATKGTDFRHVEQAEMDAIQRKINNRPREKLNFDSPKNVFFKNIH